MNMNNESYKRYAKAHAPKSNLIRDALRAFIFGGSICAMGQGFIHLYEYVCGTDHKTAVALASASLAVIAIILTAFGVFDKIARIAGAGTLVPITGFANAVASPSIDSKAEGWILGVGTKMFSVAGPVIVYGISAGVVWGVIYWVYTLICG